MNFLTRNTPDRIISRILHDTDETYYLSDVSWRVGTRLNEFVIIHWTLDISKGKAWTKEKSDDLMSLLERRNSTTVPSTYIIVQKPELGAIEYETIII